MNLNILGKELWSKKTQFAQLSLRHVYLRTKCHEKQIFA